MVVVCVDFCVDVVDCVVGLVVEFCGGVVDFIVDVGDLFDELYCDCDVVGFRFDGVVGCVCVV